ncbi:hypothetical protein ES705_38451 [subsurface metagenome]
MLVIITPEQGPLAVGGVQVTSASQLPASLSTVMSNGQFLNETEHEPVDPIPY